jgi:LysR family transcriptional regulator (chromosome initiation inhibitor)
MQFEYPLLEALAAVLREGTFDAAARSLNITQSAVSQRVKLLEEKAGAILVVRGRPCVATDYGQRLYRHVEQVHLLEHDLRKRLSSIEYPSSGRPAVIRIAVNMDSLETWFPEVILRAGSELNLHFDIIPAMEYIAVATPRFMATNFRDGISLEAVSNATHLVFDRKDLLLQQWFLNAFGEPAPHVGHSVPSVSGYLACTVNGAAWGLNPHFSVESHLDDGTLIELVPGTSVVVPLYWQSSGPGSEIMKILSSIVVDVARKYLVSSPDQGLMRRLSSGN